MMYDSSDRGLASMTRAAAMAATLCFSALAPAWPPISPRARARDDTLAPVGSQGRVQ